MANEYPQYSLIQQISKGGVDTSGELLQAYRSGLAEADKSAMDALKMQTQKLTNKQLEEQIQAQAVKTQAMQLELDQSKKKVPLWDAQTELQLNDTANKLQLQPTEFKYATMKLLDQIRDLPLQEGVAHLTAFNELVTAARSSPEHYKQFLSHSDITPFVQEFGLSGDLTKDAPMLDSIQAATMQVPKIQEALINKQASIASAERIAAGRYASNERIAQLRADSLLKRATLAQELKIKNPRKDDVIIARAELAADPNLENATPHQLDALAGRMAKRQLAYEMSSHVDPATAGQMAMQDILDEVAKVQDQKKGIVGTLSDDIRHIFGVKTVNMPPPAPFKSAADETNPNVGELAKQQFGDYSPDKYDYRIHNGIIQRRKK